MTAIIILILQFTIPQELMMRAGFSMAKEDVSVDEGLPPFYDVVNLKDANQILKEQDTMQRIYGFEIYEHSKIEHLSKCLDRYPRISITGCPWYNILNNNDYAESFAYVPPHTIDRDFYIEDCDSDDENNGEQSDLVLILLNLGSIPDYVASKFSMRQNFSGKFKQIMQDYKTIFKEQRGVDWNFSNRQNIKKYNEFIERQTKEFDVKLYQIFSNKKSSTKTAAAKPSNQED